MKVQVKIAVTTINNFFRHDSVFVLVNSKDPTAGGRMQDLS